MTHRYNTRFQAKQSKQSAQTTESKNNATSTLHPAFTKHWSTLTRDELLACCIAFPSKSIQTAPALTSNQVHSDTTNDEKKELDMVKTLLTQAEKETDPIKMALLANRVYSFLEWNHIILRNYEKFRSIVRVKANEFIAISKDRHNTLKYLSPTSKEYSSLRDRALVTQELRETCERVVAIINKL